MGLTIHYDLQMKTESAEEAAQKIQALHAFAKTLPFATVDDVVKLSGDDAAFSKGPADDPLSWLKCQATKFVEPTEVEPTEVIAFATWPGEGCEAANFGLCRYPATTLSHQGNHIRTNLKGWSWTSFCKTQYASNVNTAHFLRCHIMIVKMLDKAKELGILAEVHDEGEYWENRNAESLAKEVGEWNEMVAGALNAFEKSFSNDVVVAPIKDRPDFEHLEAKGVDKLKKNQSGS